MLPGPGWASRTTMSEKYIKRLFLPKFGMAGHAPKTLEIFIEEGFSLATLTADELKRELCMLCSLSPAEFEGLYNYGTLRKWYVTIRSKELYEKMHLKEFHRDLPPGVTSRYRVQRISITHADKSGQRGMLKWLPSKTSDDDIMAILKSISSQDSTPTFKRIDQSNVVQFTISLEKEDVESVPHYIILTNEANKESRVLIILNGRRVQCCHCNTDRHLPKMCEHLRTRALDGVQLVDGQYRAIEPWDANDKEEVREHLSNNRNFLKHWDSYDVDGERQNEMLREARHREVEDAFGVDGQTEAHHTTVAPQQVNESVTETTIEAEAMETIAIRNSIVTGSQKDGNQENLEAVDETINDILQDNTSSENITKPLKEIKSSQSISATKVSGQLSYSQAISSSKNQLPTVKPPQRVVTRAQRDSKPAAGKFGVKRPPPSSPPETDVRKKTPNNSC